MYSTHSPKLNGLDDCAECLQLAIFLQGRSVHVLISTCTCTIHVCTQHWNVMQCETTGEGRFMELNLKIITMCCACAHKAGIVGERGKGRGREVNCVVHHSFSSI